MSLLERLSKLFQRQGNGQLQKLAEPMPNKRQKGRYSYQIQRYSTVPKAEIGQDELRMAIASAEDSNLYYRYDLLTIYREVMRDLHLKSQVRTAIYKVVKEPWQLLQNGKRNEEAEKLLKTVWFEDCLWLALEAEFWGFSLIEIQELDKEGSITEVKLIPREHVRPEHQLILLRPFDREGIDYTMPLLSNIYIEAGDREDLGLLADAARYAIYKRFSMSDWARSSEKWGDPMLVIKTASDDQAELNRKEAHAKNFGSNSYMITDDQDDVTLLQRNSQGSSHLVYKDLIQIMDEENSKGVNGQTATSEEKSFVGSAQVQERILNDYTDARLRSLYFWVNTKLLPFLAKQGPKYQELGQYEWMPEIMLQKATAREAAGAKKLTLNQPRF